MNAARKYDILNNNDYELTTFRTKLEEIKNDPFNLGSDVKGLTPMNHERNLNDFAEELVANYAKFDDESFYLSLSKIPDDEQGELARLYMEYTDRDTSECVYGEDFTIDNEFTCALLALLKEDSHENRVNLAEVTRKNTILYYKKSLQKVIDEACDAHLLNLYNEDGYHSQQCRDTGEISWNRI